MRYFSISNIFIILFVFIAYSNENDMQYFLTAEWEPHQAMIVNFENEPEADSVVVEMTKYLSDEMKVYCIVLTDSIGKILENEFLKRGVDLSKIQFINMIEEIYPFSCRDPLFFVKDQKGALNIMNFKWLDYGLRYEPWANPELISKWQKEFDLYKKQFQATFGYSIISPKMAIEGGAIEVNGNGTVIQVESVNMHRNPNLTKLQQEDYLKKYIGIKKVIWLKEGAAEDPLGHKHITMNYFGFGTKGHVDEFCRFVNDSTIFLAFPDSIEAIQDPVKKITRERMEVNYQILKNSKAQVLQLKKYSSIKTRT
jgi:agmatine deiminase